MKEATTTGSSESGRAPKEIFALVLVSVLATLSLSGCSQEQRSPQMYSAIIDVRTQEEWSSGHLNGAVRIGIADSNFKEQLGQLDKAADYYIYCRSGNRAGQAIDIMRDMGFTGELVNGGSVANAGSELNLEIVVG